MDGREFARIVEQELAARGIKKGDFYNKVGISATALYGWKRGAVPSAETIAAVEDFFGISLSDYEKGDELEHLRDDLRILLKSASDLPPSSVYKLISQIEEEKERNAN